jgi:hypothetical protein
MISLDQARRKKGIRNGNVDNARSGMIEVEYICNRPASRRQARVNCVRGGGDMHDRYLDQR